MYAEFTDDLITGNEMIDSQHRELISRINDLLVSCENRSNQSGAARLLNYLADYTDFHFKEEEAFQKEIGYPGLKEHLEKHEGPSDAFVSKVAENVRDWLYYHIKGFDRSVAEYKYMRDSADRI